MKFRYKLFFITVFAIFLEIVIFNFPYVSGMLNGNIEKNISYNLEDIEKVNWRKVDNSLISEQDPMLTISNIDTYVKDFELSFSIDKKIPFIMIYYTQNEDDTFNDKMSIALTDNLRDKNEIKVNSFVKDLRVDLGDDAGVKLNSLDVVINPVKLNISISRIIAILLIYIVGIGLFYLQRSPNFEDLINNDEGDKE